jgi:ABC-2 type transport system permease protein
MGGIGIWAGAVVLVLKRGDTIVSTAIFAMGILGGAMFPISVLPGWVQPLSHLMPTRFAFHGLRTAIFLGHAWGSDAARLLLFDIVSLPIAVWAFGYALHWGKRMGSLAQY